MPNLTDGIAHLPEPLETLYKLSFTGKFLFYLLIVGSVQFSSKWYLCTQKSPYVLHTTSQKSPQHRLWNSSSVCLIYDNPLSSPRERSSSTSSFHTSLFQVISGVMSLALCLQLGSQAPQHFRSSEMQATYDGCFSHQSVCSVIYFPSLWLVHGSTPTVDC